MKLLENKIRSIEKIKVHSYYTKVTAGHYTEYFPIYFVSEPPYFDEKQQKWILKTKKFFPSLYEKNKLFSIDYLIFLADFGIVPYENGFTNELNRLISLDIEIDVNDFTFEKFQELQEKIINMIKNF